MTTAEFLADELRRQGFGPIVGVPCSFLAPLVTWCEQHWPDGYLAANNEGEAVAIAAGMAIGGGRPVVMMQNSGLGNAINPLTSLCHTMRIPVLLLITWRGEPGRHDEPQHQLMGTVTPSLLNLLDISYNVLAIDDAELGRQLETASCRMSSTGLPHALLVRRGTIESSPEVTSHSHAGTLRRDVIGAVMDGLDPRTVVVATTGKTARELEADWDRPANLYVVGSMGCASSIALGIARQQKNRKIIVLDGDGAALMRLEAMVSIGAGQPGQLTHVLLDNAAYESTGAQATNSPNVDFVGIARACGYRSASATIGDSAVAALISDCLRDPGPHFLRVSIATGSDPKLGRPAMSPPEATQRLRAELVKP